MYQLSATYNNFVYSTVDNFLCFLVYTSRPNITENSYRACA